MTEEKTFNDAVCEYRGYLAPGKLSINYQGVIFKNRKNGKVTSVAPKTIKSVHWGRLGHGFGFRIVINEKKGSTSHRFGVFKPSEYDEMSNLFERNYKVKLEKQKDCYLGHNWGSPQFEDGMLKLTTDDATVLEMPLGCVSNVTAAKNEVTLEFHQNEDISICPVEMRFHIPNAPDDFVGPDPVERFAAKATESAEMIIEAGEALLTLKDANFVTPRGRYDIKVFPSFVQLHGKTFDYKISNAQVIRLFVVPHFDRRQMFFVINVDPPVVQGKTRYHFLTILFNQSEDETEVDLGMTEEELTEKFENRLKPQIRGKPFELLGKVLRGVVNRSIISPKADGFVSAGGNSGIPCSFKAASGILFPLSRGILFLHKPTMYVRYDEVSHVTFARGGGSMRSFDVEIEKKDGNSLTFNSIEKDELDRVQQFITGKDIRIKNLGDKQKLSYAEQLENENDDGHDAYMERVKREADEADESDDDDFDPDAIAGGTDDSDVAEEYDSEVSESNSEESESEKTRRIEKAKTKEKKKDKKVSREKKDKKGRKKDPDAPKKPMSAYFQWFQDNRERIKSKNPNVKITEVARIAGQEWKDVSESEKKRYQGKFEKDKQRYEEEMKDYKPASSSGSKKKSSAKAGQYSSKEIIGSDDDASSSESEAESKKKGAKKDKKAEKRKRSPSTDASSGVPSSGSDD